MKPNKPCEWAITVYGKAAKERPMHRTERFEGTIGGALGFADELESEVDFEVYQFVITRAPQSKPPFPSRD